MKASRQPAECQLGTHLPAAPPHTSHCISCSGMTTEHICFQALNISGMQDCISVGFYDRASTEVTEMLRSVKSAPCSEYRHHGTLQHLTLQLCWNQICPDGHTAQFYQQCS